MKDFLSALNSALTSRINNPVIGAFLLSWMFFNATDILIFILSSTPEKIAILSGNSTSLPVPSETPKWDYFIAPVILALGYIFLIPYIQHHLDKLKFKFIDKKRIESHNERELERYKAMAKVSKERVKTSDELNRAISIKDLENWEKQRSDFKTDTENLRNQISNLNEQVKTIQGEKETLLDEVKYKESNEIELNSKIRELETSYTEIKALLDSSKTFMGAVNNLDSLSMEEKSQFKEYLFNNMYESGELIKIFKHNTSLLENLLHSNEFTATLTNILAKNKNSLLHDNLTSIGYLYSPKVKVANANSIETGDVHIND